MKTSMVLLRIGGAFHLLCAALHAVFPQMFQWDKHLAPLAGEGLQIITANLHIMNWCMAVLWIMLGLIPLLYPRELIETRMGKMLLFFISLFWTVRIFILQPIFVGLKTSDSIVTVAIFSIGLACFLVPLVFSLKQRKIS